MIGFRFVDEHHAEHPITDLCRIAGVSRSGYYAWRTRGPSARDTAIAGEIREIHQASRGRCGAISAGTATGAAVTAWPGSCTIRAWWVLTPAASDVAGTRP